MTESISSAGTLGTLGINVKSFVAQLINFSIIALIVWRFVYGPLMRVLHERSRSIAEGLARAEESKAELARAKEQAEAILKQARTEAQTVLDQGKTEAIHERDVLKAQGMQQATQELVQARAQINVEQQTMQRSVSHQAADLITRALEAVLPQTIPPKQAEKLVDEQLRVFRSYAHKK